MEPAAKCGDRAKTKGKSLVEIRDFPTIASGRDFAPLAAPIGCQVRAA
jgi:hypothetical protein